VRSGPSQASRMSLIAARAPRKTVSSTTACWECLTATQSREQGSLTGEHFRTCTFSSKLHRATYLASSSSPTATACFAPIFWPNTLPLRAEKIDRVITTTFKVPPYAMRRWSSRPSHQAILYGAVPTLRKVVIISQTDQPFRVSIGRVSSGLSIITS